MLIGLCIHNTVSSLNLIIETSNKLKQKREDQQDKGQPRS